MTIHANTKNDIFKLEILDNYVTRILDTKYKNFNTNKVAIDQKHLNRNQYLDLEKVLPKYRNLFDGSSGVNPNQKIHIDLLPGLKMVPGATPSMHGPLCPFKQELQYMLDIGILEEYGPS